MSNLPNLGLDLARPTETGARFLLTLLACYPGPCQQLNTVVVYYQRGKTHFPRISLPRPAAAVAWWPLTRPRSGSAILHSAATSGVITVYTSLSTVASRVPGSPTGSLSCYLVLDKGYVAVCTSVLLVLCCTLLLSTADHPFSAR